MQSFKKIFKQTINDFIKNFYINLKFEVIYTLVISFILIPLMSICLNYFISLSGKKLITNSELIKFSTSIPGLCAFILLLIMSGISIIIELGTLIFISKETYYNQKPNLKTAFFCSISNLPKIFSLGAIRIIGYIIFLVPLLGLGINCSLNTSIEIPTFILDTLFENIWGMLLFVLLISIAYFFLIRWIFSLHIALLENKNFKSALTKSKQLCKGNYLYLFKTLLFFHFVLVFSDFILFFISSNIIKFIVAKIGINSFISLSILSLYCVILTICFILFSLFTSPFNVTLITRLYFSLNDNKITNLYNISYNNTYNNINIHSIIKKNKKLTYLLLLIIIGISFILSFVIHYTEIGKISTRITAHRGNCNEAPENTLAAIQTAISSKADFAEIDVQETKDGVIVLTHDSNLKRLTGVNRNIWEVTLDELQTYHIKNIFHERYKNEKFPTLKDVIKEAKGKIKLNIELKINSHEKALAEKVISIIKEENFQNNCVISSLNYNILKKVRNLDPSLKIGYIMYIAFGDLGQLDVDFYSIETSNITENLINRAHLINREVHVWTVDDKEKVKDLMDLGVDNIITNSPKEMRNLIDKIKNKNLIQLILE